MAPPTFLSAIAAIAAILLHASPILGASIVPSLDSARERGPQIFNAVHDSMRQWGSSLHHNGMSFFLATVPEGVLLHHGNIREETPAGPEWLAFEIEHAQLFARPRRGPPRRDQPGDGAPPPNDNRRDDGQQHVLGEIQREEEEEEEQHGWLHVYRTTRALRFLYVDGMGAGKTDMGTLDSQDYILRGLSVSTRDDKKPPRGGGPMDERQRAADLCKLCEQWDLQGVIRMEAGFEIIKCDFSDGMEQVQTLQRLDPERGGSPGTRPGGGGLEHMEYVRGVTERYTGIGSSRTHIDYSSMVSAFFFPVNITNPDPKRPDLPRLLNTTDDELAAIRVYLRKVVRDRWNEPSRSIDWQDVTDIIVARYADRLKFMAETVDSLQVMKEEIEVLLGVYIDYSGREEGITRALDRCTDFYLGAVTPITETNWLVYAAVRSVTRSICSDLFMVREVITVESSSHDSTLIHSQAILQRLMDFLRWARFKRCPPCAIDEVCLIPMWPFGTVEDYKSPRCTNGSDTVGSESYWGGFRGGPPDRGNDTRPPFF